MNRLSSIFAVNALGRLNDELRTRIKDTGVLLKEGKLDEKAVRYFERHIDELELTIKQVDELIDVVMESSGV
jgi:hypothetical protein